jgi:hypothetical protein
MYARPLQVGRTLSAMVANVEAVEPLLEQCRAASAAELEAGIIKVNLEIKHRYLDPVPVTIAISMGGQWQGVELQRPRWPWQ